MDRRSLLAALASLGLTGVASPGGATPSPLSQPPKRGAPSPAQAAPRRPGSAAPADGGIQTIRSVRGLPPDIVGVFRDPTAFEQAASGQYFVFDRLAHTVYGVDRDMQGSWKIVQIGREAGRILEPTAFALAPNGTFVVADRPSAAERVQFFGPGGNLIGGFTLPGRAGETVVLGSLVLNGIGSLQYDGRTLYMSQPETGSLVSQYSPAGVPLRGFGMQRATGHENERDVHLALNSGLPVVNPLGGHYFVFQAGIPVFRKYDEKGQLLFERHIEGADLDPIIAALPTRWPTRSAGGRETPMVAPVVRTARADPQGRLWVSFAAVPVTYVYDAAGEKLRMVRFQGAGIISPSSFFFTQNGRLLVTPGCYEFDPAVIRA